MDDIVFAKHVAGVEDCLAKTIEEHSLRVIHSAGITSPYHGFFRSLKFTDDGHVVCGTVIDGIECVTLDYLDYTTRVLGWRSPNNILVNEFVFDCMDHTDPLTSTVSVKSHPVRYRKLDETCPRCGEIIHVRTYYGG